jgi:hypothetical protein
MLIAKYMYVICSILASALSGGPRPSSIPDNYFGMTVIHFAKVNMPLAFGTMRSWDASPGVAWADSNPSPGVYDFTNLDKLMKLAQSHNAELLYTLGRPPQWASSRPTAKGPYGPGQCAAPNNLKDWDDYLSAIATHAAGKIKYWEVWNEPDDPRFYCGDIATMVTLAQHANRILKKIDPRAVILSPAVTGGPGPEWIGQFLSSGGASLIDVVSFHGYWSSKAEDVNTVVASYQAVMKANNIATKPLWDTEASWAGFGKNPIANHSQRAAFLAKYYLLQWSDGVSRFIWYAYDGGNTWGGIWDAEAAGLHADGVAYQQVYRWMVGASLSSPCVSDSSGTWSCTLSRAGGYKAVAVWNSTRSVKFAVPHSMVEYRDLTGASYTINTPTIEVSNQPILLETRPLPE